MLHAYHEARNEAVELDAIVVAALAQQQEVVARARRLCQIFSDIFHVVILSGV